MKTLYLPLRREWYEMIERGEKLEEYRVKSAYWIARLLEWRFMPNAHTVVTEQITMEGARIIADKELNAYCGHLIPKHYDVVCFSYGYTKRRMTFKVKNITIGCGRREWGAPDHDTFIIELGARIL